jgi:hypothetical protein
MSCGKFGSVPSLVTRLIVRRKDTPLDLGVAVLPERVNSLRNLAKPLILPLSDKEGIRNVLKPHKLPCYNHMQHRFFVPIIGASNAEEPRLAIVIGLCTPHLHLLQSGGCHPADASSGAVLPRLSTFLRPARVMMETVDLVRLDAVPFYACCFFLACSS